MEKLGWIEVIQSLIIAGSAWYVRRGSKKDAKNIAASTASQSTSSDILSRVQKIELDLEIMKVATLKDNPIDHRSPKG